MDYESFLLDPSWANVKNLAKSGGKNLAKLTRK
jgi:hypothetical protein